MRTPCVFPLCSSTHRKGKTSPLRHPTPDTRPLPPRLLPPRDCCPKCNWLCSDLDSPGARNPRAAPAARWTRRSAKRTERRCAAKVAEDRNRTQLVEKWRWKKAESMVRSGRVPFRYLDPTSSSVENGT